MYRGTLHGEHGATAIFDELTQDVFVVVVLAAVEMGKGSHTYDVAVTSHDGDCLKQVFAFIAVHDNSTFRLEFPCTLVHIEHNYVHAEIHSGFLCAETGSQAVVEEYQQRGAVFAEVFERIVVFLYFGCFFECLL